MARPYRVVRCCTLLMGALVSCVAVAAEDDASAGRDELQAGLVARVSFHGLAGTPLASPRAGEPFRIVVALHEALTGAPSRLPRFDAWIRSLEPGAARCADAAQAFRVTRRAPAGALDLNGVAIGVLNQDDSIGIIDPRLDLASSNMLAAGRFASRPFRIVADPFSQAVLASLPEAGRIDALSALDGQVRVRVDGLRNPRDLFMSDDGRLWVGEAGRVSAYAADGSRTVGDMDDQRLPVHLAATSGQVVAWNTAGEVRVFGGASGPSAPAATGALGAGLEALAVFESAGALGLVAALREPARVAIGYLDLYSPAAVTWQHVALPHPVNRVAVSPDGRHAFVWSDQDAGMSIVDIALARVEQAVVFNAGNAAQGAVPVSEIAFTADAVFMLLANHAAVAVLDPATIARGRPPQIREVRLGPARESSNADEHGLLTALTPSPRVLATHSDSATAFLIESMSGEGGMPPMSALRLRGGIPRALVVQSRSFIPSGGAGRFVNHAMLPHGGQHELLLTTGVGGLSLCHAFEVEGEPQPMSERALLLEVRVLSGAARAGQPTTLELRTRDVNGNTGPLGPRTLVFPAMTSNWRGRATLAPQGDGTARAEVVFPVAGHYALQLLPGAGEGAPVAAAVLEVRP